MNQQRRIGWTLVVIALPCVAFAVFFLVSALSMQEPQYWRFSAIEATGLVLAAVSSATLFSGFGLLRSWRFALHSAAALIILFMAFWGLGALQFCFAFIFDTEEFVAQVQENLAVNLGAVALTLAAFVWCVRSLQFLLRQGSRDAADA